MKLRFCVKQEKAFINEMKEFMKKRFEDVKLFVCKRDKGILEELFTHNKKGSCHKKVEVNVKTKLPFVPYEFFNHNFQ